MNFHIINRENGQIKIPAFSLNDMQGDKISNKSHEFAEQVLLFRYLRGNDCVLELGANIGCSSIVINKLLKEPFNHVCLEPIPQIFKVLKKNLSANGASCSALEGYIGDVPNLPFRPFGHNLTASRQVHSGSHSVVLPRCYTLEEAQSYVGKPFSVLFADCEGCLPGVIESFPALLEGLRLLIYESDIHGEMNKIDYEEMNYRLSSRGFKKLSSSNHRHVIWTRP